MSITARMFHGRDDRLGARLKWVQMSLCAWGDGFPSHRSNRKSLIFIDCWADSQPCTSEAVQDGGMHRPLLFTPADGAMTAPVLGGTAWLDAHTPWPTSIHGHALLHLASFSAAFIRSHVAGLYIAPGLSISVFTPYITPGEQRFEEAMSHGGRAIAHWPWHEPTVSPCVPIGPRRICAGTAMDERGALQGTSQIGGRPCWQQDDESEGQAFILQFDEFDLDRAAPTHRGILVGGMGYLLLDRNIPSPSMDCGRFVIQTT
ncbi:hypothetical protein STENOSP10_07240 [Stenotrophomonas sepilia]|uniref:DUF1963 domain-containing protein n=2 Tax=Stenotrophomonas TaxID=40323 RepID=A0ABQ6QBW7_9GAMM|nr:hypothetical protein STENOSP10_07240 [Stenotrophomonas sepilia]